MRLYSMPRFRKKPIVIDAFRLGEKGRPTPAPAWFGSPDPSAITGEGILIRTLEGVMLARWGDWVIRGVKGELYPIKDSIFRETYDLEPEIGPERDPEPQPPSKAQQVAHKLYEEFLRKGMIRGGLTMRSDLRAAADASWARDEAGYRHLARDGKDGPTPTPTGEAATPAPTPGHGLPDGGPSDPERVRRLTLWLWEALYFGPHSRRPRP